MPSCCLQYLRRILLKGQVTLEESGLGKNVAQSYNNRSLREMSGGLPWTRFAPKDSSEAAAAAEAAVAELLAAAEASGRGRPAGTAGAAWRSTSAAQTANRGGPAGPSDSMQRLHAMYTADDPPPIQCIRHPQVCHPVLPHHRCIP